MPAHPDTAEKAAALAAAVGLDVTHAHDDLLFTRHNHFLLMTHESHPGMVSLFFNEETGDEEAATLHATLTTTAAGKGLTLRARGEYRMAQGQGEQLALELLPFED